VGNIVINQDIKNTKGPVITMQNNNLSVHTDNFDFYTKVKYKKLNDLAKEPTRGSADAAGYDLYAATDTPIEVGPHMTVKIGTGLSFELPQYTFAAIFARSGLATKQGLRPANCVGVCDSDYRGEYIVAIHNDSGTPQKIQPGDRIAQMILLPYIPMQLKESEELTDTERGSGGFGSTGK